MQYDPFQQKAIDAINALTAKAGKPKWDYTAPVKNEPLVAAVAAQASAALGEAYRITDKQQRYTRIGQLKKEAVAAVSGEGKLVLLAGSASSTRIAKAGRSAARLLFRGR